MDLIIKARRDIYGRMCLLIGYSIHEYYRIRLFLLLTEDNFRLALGYSESDCLVVYLNGLKTNTFLFDLHLINPFRYQLCRKLRFDKESRTFKK